MSSSCLNYIGKFDGSECILINEASSSKTAFFSYNSSFAVDKINGKSKLALSSTQNPEVYRIDSYATKMNVQGYYDVIRGNAVINDYILSSSCSKFYWSLLATGGMRNLLGNDGLTIEENFYSGLAELFEENPKTCNNEVCKDITLVQARTITGQDEGKFAWLTLNAQQDSTCHGVIDVGGQTGQFANKTFSYSGNLGKERAIGKMESGSLSDDETFDDDQMDTASKTYFNYTITPCYNDDSPSKYDGISCRKNVKSYIDINLAKELPMINYDQYCKLYTISNFYNFFITICDTYLPYITQNNLKINSATLSQVQDLCLSKDITNDPLVMGIVGYQNISDEMCVYWNDAWKGDERNYAKAACFSGNYNYQLLQAFGLSNETTIHISSTNFAGDDPYIDKADWALGAAIDASETCDNEGSSSSNSMSETEMLEIVGTTSGFGGLILGVAGVYASSWLYNNYIKSYLGSEAEISLTGKAMQSDVL